MPGTRSKTARLQKSPKNMRLLRRDGVELVIEPDESRRRVVENESIQTCYLSRTALDWRWKESFSRISGIMRNTALISSLGEEPDVSLHLGSQFHQTHFSSRRRERILFERPAPSVICSKGSLKDGENGQGQAQAMIDSSSCLSG